MLERILTALGGLLDRLSLARVGLAFLLTLLSVLSLAIYENREAIYAKVFAPGKLTNSGLQTLSQESRDRANEVMSSHPHIALMSIIKFDFEAGTRVPIFRAYNDKEIGKIMSERIRRSNPDFDPGTLQLFTSDPNSNREIISVLNGELACSKPTENSGIMLAWPEMRGRITLSCRIPIPPATSYGAPRGYIAIHMTGPVSQERADAAIKELLSLAMFIYLNDVRGTTSFKTLERASQ